MNPLIPAQAQLPTAAAGAPHADEGKQVEPVPQPMHTEGQWAMARSG